MNENTNMPGSKIPIDTSGVTSVSHHDAYIVMGDKCWVCEIGVSRPEYFEDKQGTTHMVHNWCIAGAETKSRREFVEGS